LTEFHLIQFGQIAKLNISLKNRLKLLTEEMELGTSGRGHPTEERRPSGDTGTGNWAKWLQEKQGQLKMGGGGSVPGDLKLLSAELEQCDQ
jgi:hypothetical protein